VYSLIEVDYVAQYARSSASHRKQTKKYLDAVDDIARKYKLLRKKYYKLKYGNDSE
jgi:hypothetical protein